ncbi:unnamed protein product [Arabidopsis halleri]
MGPTYTMTSSIGSYVSKSVTSSPPSVESDQWHC